MITELREKQQRQQEQEEEKARKREERVKKTEEKKKAADERKKRQLEKQTNKNAKKAKNSEKGKSVMKAAVAVPGTNSDSDSNNVDQDYYCADCNMPWFDEEDEPWVSCRDCKKWFHEDCTRV